MTGRTLDPVTCDLGGVKPKQVLKLPLLEWDEQLLQHVAATISAGRCRTAPSCGRCEPTPIRGAGRRSCTSKSPRRSRRLADRRPPGAAQPGAHGGAKLREPPPSSTPRPISPLAGPPRRHVDQRNNPFDLRRCPRVHNLHVIAGAPSVAPQAAASRQWLPHRTVRRVRADGRQPHFAGGSRLVVRLRAGRTGRCIEPSIADCHSYQPAGPAGARAARHSGRRAAAGQAGPPADGPVRTGLPVWVGRPATCGPGSDAAGAAWAKRADGVARQPGRRGPGLALSLVADGPQRPVHSSATRSSASVSRSRRLRPADGLACRGWPRIFDSRR
jgi:hypothetical protein